MNKAISTPIVIIIIICAILAGGLVTWQYFGGQKEVKLLEKKGVIGQEEQTINETEISQGKTLEQGITEEGPKIPPKEAIEPHIKVIFPNGREILDVKKNYDIVWKSEGINKVDIWLFDYYAGQLAKQKIASNIPAYLGKYSWTPSGSGEDFKIQINQAIGEENKAEDSSNYYFTTITSAMANWEIYRNEKHEFEIKYPKSCEITEQEDTILIGFPPPYDFLQELFIVKVEEGTLEDCYNTLIEATSKPKETSIIDNGVYNFNNIEFHKYSGKGPLYSEYITNIFRVYCTTKENKYYFLYFAVAFDTSDPAFIEMEKWGTTFIPESELFYFDEISYTFKFLE